jgi:hypothetical protein
MLHAEHKGIRNRMTIVDTRTTKIVTTMIDGVPAPAVDATDSLKRALVVTEGLPEQLTKHNRAGAEVPFQPSQVTIVWHGSRATHADEWHWSMTPPAVSGTRIVKGGKTGHQEVTRTFEPGDDGTDGYPTWIHDIAAAYAPDGDAHPFPKLGDTENPDPSCAAEPDAEVRPANVSPVIANPALTWTAGPVTVAGFTLPMSLSVTRSAHTGGIGIVVQIARTIIRTSIATSTIAGQDTGLSSADAGTAVRPVAAA